MLKDLGIVGRPALRKWIHKMKDMSQPRIVVQSQQTTKIIETTITDTTTSNTSSNSNNSACATTPYHNQQQQHEPQSVEHADQSISKNFACSDAVFENVHGEMSMEDAANSSSNTTNDANLLGSRTNTNGMFNSNTSFDGSDDEHSQLTHSNSIAHNGGGDHSHDSMSDSQSTKSSERNDSAASKAKKSKKRNRISQMIAGVSHKSKSELFQKLFKNMAADELLVSDYSCALQRDILVHGRLYLSQTWLCFYANIFGWETLVTIRWVDITAITKEKTAKLIPNAIQIFTDTDKYFFSTFVTREHAYTALFRIWQNALLGQPMLPKDLKSICKRKNGSRGETREGTPLVDDNIETGDEMLEYDDDKSFVSTSESVPINGNGDDSKLGSITDDMQLSSEKVGDDGVSPSGSPISPSWLGADESKSTDKSSSSLNGKKEDQTSLPSNSSGSKDNDKQHSTSTPNDKTKRHRKENSLPEVRNADSYSPNNRKNVKTKRKHHTRSFPSSYINVANGDAGSSTDNESESEQVLADPDEDVLCPCHDCHKGSEYINEEFNFDVDALYEHLFSQESDLMKTVFSKRKFQGTKYTPYQREEDGSHSQVLSYTIPLNYSIGPKQCHTATKHIMPKDNLPGSYYTIKTESTTTGIPYGDCFYVCTQYCITRASGNRSRLRITSDIVYIKRVFGLVKNMISRGSDEAFKDYTNFLLNILKSESDLLSYKNITPPKPKPKPTKKLSSTHEASSSKPNFLEVPRKKSIPEVTLHHPPKTSYHEEHSGTGHHGGHPEHVEPESRKFPTGIFFIIFCLLLFMNLYMLQRVRVLEHSLVVATTTTTTKSPFQKPDSWLPDKLPTSKEDWKALLDYQKSLHELELVKLREVIGNTASVLQQVQVSMKMLYANVEKNIGDGSSSEKEEEEKDISNSARHLESELLHEGVHSDNNNDNNFDEDDVRQAHHHRKEDLKEVVSTPATTSSTTDHAHAQKVVEL